MNKVVSAVLISVLVAFIVPAIPYVAEVLRYEIHGMLTVAIFVMLVFIYKELVDRRKE
ncbi:hypothetical protein NQZ71_14150 [Niallia taxi]|uniref:hypothetical protein n=1 Tax=Niallia taxi TaxID=2499688 RepID=UPI0023A9C781|nr:hypothetical protein [Niallia taxi]MDE5051630.1 hypothetical protein [Niallia taxi]WOD61945.1 hypothetical protein NQZ71_14150 [Niallia taxi]